MRNLDRSAHDSILSVSKDASVSLHTSTRLVCQVIIFDNCMQNYNRSLLTAHCSLLTAHCSLLTAVVLRHGLLDALCNVCQNRVTSALEIAIQKFAFLFGERFEHIIGSLPGAEGTPYA
jgi:hypothetical protein